MGDTKASLRATVRGAVQGVGFRDFVCFHAHRLNLTGYVRNMPNGVSMEVQAGGTRRALLELRDLLWQGPPASLVLEVKEDWSPASEEFTAFTISR